MVAAPWRRNQINAFGVAHIATPAFCGQVVRRPFLSHKQESHVRLMGPHPISVKCYGSTEVSKTLGEGSTPCTGASFI